MKLSKTAVILIFIIMVLSVGTAYAVEAPLFPSIYKGTVVDQTGAAVAAGTIKAYIADDLKGAVDFTGGEYARLLVQADSAAINQPVIFKVMVNDVELAAVSSPAAILWQSGKISGMDISAIKLTVDLTSVPATLPPAANNASGSYSGTLQVALSCPTSGANIYYTLDNSDPKTSTSRIKYTAAFNVDKNTTLLAVAELNGIFSIVKTYTYTFSQAQVEVSITAADITMQVGAMRQLTVSTSPSGVTLRYQSSNTNAVSVSASGSLTAKAAGSATITVTGSKTGMLPDSDTVNVTVSKNPVGLTVYPESVSLKIGESKQLNVSKSPSDASVTYTSDNANVAKVSATGLVTAVSNGSAYIKVKAVKVGYDDASWSVAVKVADLVVPPAGATTAFSDIPSGYWALLTINSLTQLGVTGGYEDGSFKPNKTITRAEFTKMLAKSMGLADQLSGAAKFTDVAPGTWYFGSIQAAASAGLVSGDQSGTFRPNDNITRQEMAIALVRALGKNDLAQSKAGEATSFKDDKAIAGWARGYTVAAVQDGLVNGYPADNTFKPMNRATRAEACTMISRFLEKKI